MESNEAQRDASFAANSIFHESWVPVRTSKFYGAFVLNRRVDLHAIESAASSMAWRCRLLAARRSQHGRVIAEK